MAGTGIDIVEIHRIEAAMDKHGGLFLDKLFGKEEQDYCSGKARPAVHYAGRFAAKEAVSKALGTGIGEKAGWLDIVIERCSESGAVNVRLTGRAEKTANDLCIDHLAISIAHCRDYAVAHAVACR